MAILASSAAYAADNQHFTPPHRTEIGDSVASDPSGEWRLSTSLPAWIAGVTNIAGEYVFSRHWSAGLYMSYSGWNYFRQTQKFRVAEFRPEVRYWFGGNARASLSRDIWLSYHITSRCRHGTSAIRTAGAAIPPSAGASGPASAAISPATASGRGKPLSDSADIISTTTASRTPALRGALSTRRSANFSASTTSHCQ